jgi:hypothetical protein
MAIVPPQLTVESWKPILSSAVAILDDLDRRGFGSPDLTLDGGTVLMLRLGHRLSKDIDLFLTDVRWLALLTPRLNDFSASLTGDYVEQSNSVKLVLAVGDIDFIAAAPVTRVGATEILNHQGRGFQLEATEEILAKKLLYRAEQLKPRDVFDLVAAAEADRDTALRAVLSAATKRPVLERRLAYLARQSLEELSRDIWPLAGFAPIVDAMIGTTRELFKAGFDGKIAGG